jgi:hypothetical protein
VIGGTKGNFILEYVSGAPNKARINDRIPNVFDYDELTKYGFSVSKSSCPHIVFRTQTLQILQSWSNLVDAHMGVCLFSLGQP